ncbi:hypothetical protein GWK47_039109 [Chionoecetes opilio]|uniref:Tube Death domain-containing protein n=1 Tax=Chionoecetes opilio TaxID=41210 RepID=A0A8J4YM90_CHIOP|nr:hypothetical protein GWK47_039109 [Chionoecetes opilio]
MQALTAGDGGGSEMIFFPSLVSEECGRDRREGFEVLVEEWGTSGRKRPTVGDLVAILQVAKLYRAMDYLTITVLNGALSAYVWNMSHMFGGDPLNSSPKQG